MLEQLIARLAYTIFKAVKWLLPSPKRLLRPEKTAEPFIILYPIIAWYDPRTAPQVRWWEEALGAGEIFRITGLPLSPIFTLNKILWLKQDQPEVFHHMKKWLSVADYIYFRLCGAMATEYSLASRTMALDLHLRQWSVFLLDLAGVARDLFPELHPSGSVVGRVTRQAALECGIPAGTSVVAGGHDHVCGALGAGVIDAGGILDSCGTAETLLGVLPHDVSNLKSGNGFAIGCHVVPDMYYLQGGLTSSGISVDWITELFQAGPSEHPEGVAKVKTGNGTNSTRYKKLMEEAASAPVGARGAMFLPHLRGSGPPVRDPSSRGTFLGLRPQHQRADLVRAVIEGLCLELRLTFEAAGALLGNEVRYLRAIGGGTKNHFWLQTRADVLGKEIEVPEVKEATTLGAALLAGVGVGVYADVQDAVQRTHRIAEIIPCREDLHARYDELFDIYKGVYPTLAGLNKRLNTLELG